MFCKFFSLSKTLNQRVSVRQQIYINLKYAHNRKTLNVRNHVDYYKVTENSMYTLECLEMKNNDQIKKFNKSNLNL